MGLITRCPACGTMFKVVADQLKISEGWVRCGHCAGIFDATADLRDETEMALPVVARAMETEPQPLQESGYPSSIHSEAGDSTVGAGTPSELEEEAQAMREDPLDRPFELRREDPGEAQSVGPHGFSRPMPLEPEAPPEPDLHELSFVRQARQRAFWGRPGVRALLLLVLLLLGAVLAAQFAWKDRDRLAAMYPELRPWFVRACEPLGCRIVPPRAIETVGIETSSFNKLRGDTYRLNVTLRNQGVVAVAMPSLELTLTDSQDQAVVRRVLQAYEFAPNVTTLAPAADWSTSVAVAVNAGAAGSRIAGYRVLAFYP